MSTSEITVSSPVADAAQARQTMLEEVKQIADRPRYAARGWLVLKQVSDEELDSLIGRRTRTLRGAARQVLNKLVKPAAQMTELV